MTARKLQAHSDVLGREFHADLFDPVSKPELLVLFFGGSGRNREESERRATTIIPGVEERLARLEGSRPVRFVFVTAPYDVPFNRFATELDALDTWVEHVTTELLPLVAVDGGKVFLASYSGGAALAFNQLPYELDTVGGCALGPDGLPADFIRPDGWAEPLLLLVNQGDVAAKKSTAIFSRLEAKGQVRLVTSGPGGHSFDDYVAAGCLERVLALATAGRGTAPNR